MSQTYIFDLDNTLYHPDCGVLPAIGTRISGYIRGMGFSDAEGNRLRDEYWRAYGISLIGLMKYHGVDPVRFADYVYDIDYENRLAADERLDTILAGMGGRKYIYTNAAEIHAERVLARLGIARHFDGIVAIEHTDYAAKPMPESYERLIKTTGVDPSSSIFFDDLPRNLDAARPFGFATAIVGTAAGEFDYRLETIHDLEGVDFGSGTASKG